MAEPHPDQDALLALALDDVAEHDRRPALDHLATCRRCRHEYADLSSTIEQVLPASPRVEPPPGFDSGALAAIGFDRSRLPTSPRRRRSVLAAAVVIGLALGVGGTYAGSRLLDDQQITVAGNGSYLTTDEGEHVGTVTPGYVDGKPVIVVTVTSGPIGTDYACLLRLDNGDLVTSGVWTIRTDDGDTWVMRTPPARVVEVQLIADGGDGPLWSSARL